MEMDCIEREEAATGGGMVATLAMGGGYGGRRRVRHERTADLNRGAFVERWMPASFAQTRLNEAGFCAPVIVVARPHLHSRVKVR